MGVLASIPIIGFLILPFSIYLAFKRRQNLMLRPSVPALPKKDRFKLLDCSRNDAFLASISIALISILLLTNYTGNLLPVVRYLGFLGIALLFLEILREGNGASCVIILLVATISLAQFFNLVGPASALNYDDDLAKYLVLPVGLIAKGSVDFGPLGPQMGTASILAAGIQALYLVEGGLKWLAHWDISVSLLLGFVWIATCAEPVRSSKYQIVFASVVFFLSAMFINVMYVNISAVYLPAVLFAIAGGRLMSSSHRSFPEALSIGCIGGLIYLFKMNYIILSAGLIISYFSIVLAGSQFTLRRKFSLILTSAIPVGAFLASPILQVFVAVTSLVPTLSQTHTDLSVRSPVSAPSEPEGFAEILNTLFNLSPTFYGFGSDSYFSVNFFVLLLALSSVVLLSVLCANRSCDGKNRYRLFATSSLAGAVSSLILAAQFYMFKNGIGAVDANIRYIMPSVLGIVMLLTISPWLASFKYMQFGQLCLILIAVAFVGSQVPSAGHRFYQAIKFGNVLAFPAAREQFMVSQTEFVVGGAGKALVGQLQELIPEGATILASVGFPSLLDYKRNKVLLAEADGDLNKFSKEGKFLTEYEVDFIFWQINGLGVRTVEQWEAWASTSSSRSDHAEKSIRFLRELNELSALCNTFLPIKQVAIIEVRGCLIDGI